MKKHILILGCKNYPAFSSNKVISGGMEVYVTELTKYLKKHFKITIITADSEVVSDSDINVMNVPIFGGFVFQPVSLSFFSFFKCFRLRKKIDLINTQTPLSGLIAYVFKKLFGIPYIVSVHIFAATKEHTGNFLFSGIYYIIEKIVYSAADKIVCAGYRLQEHIVDRYKLEQDQVVVIHPGAGTTAVESEVLSGNAKTQFPNHNNTFRLLFLGRLIEENGIMDLLEAMKLIADKPVKLLIAGNGNLETSIQSYVEKHNLQEKIELLGIVTGQEKEALLRSVDALIRTSYHEVFPVAYLESLAYGVPVIATPVGDTEFMANKTGGIEIVPVNDPEKVAQAIARQMTQRGLGPDVIDNCRAYLHSISWKKQSDKTSSMFGKILDIV